MYNPGSIAAIGLGSNMPFRAASPAALLCSAFASVDALGTVVAVSSLYRTAPVGYADQAAFVNAAMILATELTPEALLGELLAIERHFGRDRSADLRNGPRTLDLDLLLQGDIVLNTPQLTLPHPAFPYRRFVLAPLAEIAPALVHPVLRLTVAELLANLPDEEPNAVTGVRRLSQASFAAAVTAGS